MEKLSCLVLVLSALLFPISVLRIHTLLVDQNTFVLFVLVLGFCVVLVCFFLNLYDKMYSGFLSADT